jgi:hypothetical protein
MPILLLSDDQWRVIAIVVVIYARQNSPKGLASRRTFHMLLLPHLPTDKGSRWFDSVQALTIEPH